MTLRLPALFLAFLISACSDQEKEKQAENSEAIVQKIMASEELMESLRKPLKNVGLAFGSAKEPREIFPDIFAPDFKGDTLGEVGESDEPGIGESTITAWEVDEKMMAHAAGAGWIPLAKIFEANADDVDFFKCYMISGEFQNDGSFKAKMGLQGRYQKESGGWVGLRAKQVVIWEKNSEPDPIQEWQISGWDFLSCETLRAPERFFENVTVEAIPNEATRHAVMRSLHEEFFVNGYTGKRVTMRPDQAHLVPILTKDSLARHPGLSVVDFDGDGWDDLYLTVRFGRNILLRNRGDGTFEDATAEAALGVPGFSSSAIFADFDNDGDPDLFLGRTLFPSLYFENEGGKFTEKSGGHFSSPLPSCVTSLSAVDYNGDGLLDIYACTYGIFGDSTADTISKNKPYLAPDRRAEFAARLQNSHRYLDMAGPPNVLLKNLGGGNFNLAPENGSLEFFYNSLQAGWSDFDDDGDADLYVANDFAPDVLMRNDGPDEEGKVRFQNVSEEIGHPTMVGFGMGVGWGDYDRDGRQDLYVSNMFSKAGLRITAQIPGLDRRIRESAEGSRLFRFDGEKFTLKSLPEPGGFDVNHAGWSWGGQFFDADNDGFLDLYATNGYYTAHPEITSEADG